MMGIKLHRWGLSVAAWNQHAPILEPKSITAVPCRQVMEAAEVGPTCMPQLGDLSSVQG